jgi:hypothetical protein
MNRAAFFFCLLLALVVPAYAQNDDVPFVTTPDNVTLAMLELAKVTPDDYLIDLGSGDGRVVITAAKRFGARALGVELVPDLVRRSKESALEAGVAERAEFREQDLFETDLSKADVITLYLLPEVNLKLRPALLKLKAGTRIVSHDWDMGEWMPDQSRVVEAPQKQVGLRKMSTLHLWTVPAQIGQGAWMALDPPEAMKDLRIVMSGQKYQQLTLSFVGAKMGTSAGMSKPFRGNLAGNRARLESASQGAIEVEYRENTLRVVNAEGEAAPFAGVTFIKVMRFDGKSFSLQRSRQAPNK